MKIDPDLLKLLMEVGFMATNGGRLKEATTIFKGVSCARPQSAYPRIGLGCVAMGYGQYAQAVEILREAPAQEAGERDLCQGFLGMALKLGGFHDECRRVLTRLQDEGQNEVAVRMADKLLEER
jgi:lipopolysaccharide biosynthesis regulator YciM